MIGPDRQQLVGLKPVTDTQLRAGAHLFDPGATATRENSLGYSTSVCHSPTLNSHLALGFLRNGRARIGEQVRLVDHLRGIDVLCEVHDPVFFDKTGEKLRA